MKKVIKKNQVIITSLAILIAVAGYLNFADVDLGVKDKEASTDSSSILEDAGYDLTDSENTSTPGEAVLTGTDSFAAQARISREQTRSQNKADLQDKEAAAELLLEAKGFEDVIVNLTGETADVVVPEEELSQAQRAQIEDIVKRKTGIAPENIVITPLNQSEEDAGDEEVEEDEPEQTEETDQQTEETAASPYEDSVVDSTDIYD